MQLFNLNYYILQLIIVTFHLQKLQVMQTHMISIIQLIAEPQSKKISIIFIGRNSSRLSS
jgi:hypothetical protein